jgi:hypothetical protein
MIAIGTHRAVVQSIQFGHASTGKEQVVVEFRLTDEHDPDVDQSVTYFGYFTDATFARTIESLRYCGWAGDDLSELPALADSGALANEVHLVIDHEEYEGKLQVKVKWVNRAGGGKLTLAQPMEASSLASFAARMKSSIRSVGAAEAAPRQRPTGGAPARGGNGGRPAGGRGFADNRDVPPPDDDDRLPF